MTGYYTENKICFCRWKP